MKTMKLNEDLATLTSVPEKIINKISSKILYCISNALVESILSGEEVTEVVTEIGSLFIQYKEGQFKYKFIPNAKLDKELKDSATTLKSSLEEALEESVVRKFDELYRDLC